MGGSGDDIAGVGAEAWAEADGCGDEIRAKMGSFAWMKRWSEGNVGNEERGRKNQRWWQAQFERSGTAEQIVV